MDFIVNIPIDQVSPRNEFQSHEAVRELAVAAERAGVLAVSISDHPAPSADWLHNDPTGHDSLDPFTALAFVAAATTRLKVLTSVVVLPYRNPFVTAKAASTLQVLSNGRLILGVGIGYQKGEFDALGVPFSARGALSDEALETIRMIWAGGVVIKQGRNFNASGNEPRPVPNPPPPIWIGGGRKAIERAARWGDGWMPFTNVLTNDPNVAAASINSLQEMKANIDCLRELRHTFGKSGELSIATTPFYHPKANTRAEAQRFCEGVHELANIGVTCIHASIGAPSRTAYMENLAWFSEEIVAAFKSTHHRKI